MRRGVLCERSDEYVTPSPDRSPHLVDIGFTIVRACEEMKHRAVVPNRICLRVEASRQDIPREPTHTRRVVAEAVPRRRKRCLREIEHCEVREASCKKIVDQNRSTPAHIDDRARMIRRELRYEFERP
jgi:hypothetical protein